MRSCALPIAAKAVELHVAISGSQISREAAAKIIRVTLLEVTPVSQAAALQQDLRRAGIEPYARVLNKSVLAAGTRDRLLAARLAGEPKQMQRMAGGLARRMLTLPWHIVPPIEFAELSSLVAKPAPAGTTHV